MKLKSTLLPRYGSALRISGGLAIVLFVMGCGNTLYLVQVNQAEQAFEEARELGAEQHSPYEFYAADARLKEAKVQAAQAEYGNATDLSHEAREYAHKAIIKSKTARNRSGTAPAPTGASQ